MVESGVRQQMQRKGQRLATKWGSGNVLGRSLAGVVMRAFCLRFVFSSSVLRASIFPSASSISALRFLELIVTSTVWSRSLSLPLVRCGLLCFVFIGGSGLGLGVRRGYVFLEKVASGYQLLAMLYDSSQDIMMFTS